MQSMNAHIALVETIHGQAMTTTLTIADHTQTEHRAVLQLLRAHFDDFEGFGKLAFEMRDNNQGPPTQIALLNESQATLLLTYMRNGDVVRKFKIALVHAFAAMRRKVMAEPDLMAALENPETLRRLLGRFSEKVSQLEHTVAEQAPKVQALDRICTATGAMSVTEAAKVLQIGPQALFKWLESNNWTYRRCPGGHWLARQQRIDQGVLIHKLVERGKHDDGSARVFDQTLVTTKGLARLSEIFEKAKSTAAALAIGACETAAN